MKVLDKRLHYHDVMIVPQVSDSVMNSRSEAIVKRILGSKHGRASINSVPVCVANMDTCGTIKMAEEIGADDGMVALHKFYDIETLINLNNKYFFNSHFYTLGINDINKLQDLIDTTGIVPNLICLDAPNGYLQSFINAIKTIRHLCSNSFIMAGNVVTSTATVKIIEAGADCAKVGISQGSHCVTAKVTGVGYPQLSAVIECSAAAHKIGGYICADGGIKEIGDICKALVGGADLVMAGGIFTGFEENEGEWDYAPIPPMPMDGSFHYTGDLTLFGAWKQHCLDTMNLKRLKVYGMSSREAQDKYYGEKDYRASEGKCSYVDYKGKVRPFFKEILGGVRSCATYIGAKSVKDFNKCGDLVIC